MTQKLDFYFIQFKTSEFTICFANFRYLKLLRKERKTTKIQNGYNELGLNK